HLILSGLQILSGSNHWDYAADTSYAGTCCG
ncbi:phage tail protein, partial [Shigella sonnei]|nr:phage tail protein [Shigella sonnei]